MPQFIACEEGWINADYVRRITEKGDRSNRELTLWDAKGQILGTEASWEENEFGEITLIGIVMIRPGA